MIIDLNQLEETVFPFDFQSKPDLNDESVSIVSEISARGTLKRKPPLVEVEGRISGELKAECFRCLSPLRVPIDFSFRDLFVSKEEFSDASESEVHGDDLSLSIYEDDKIDLSEVVREAVLLNLPTQLLCREDCKGLCSKCGANKNDTVCGCEEKEVDPRWLALKNLK